MTREEAAVDGSVVNDGPEPVVRLVRWPQPPSSQPWPDDDPDANLKADVAAYAHLDPVATLRPLAAGTGIPIGALVRYILARWASGGSEGALELGPSTVQRMRAVCDEAEAADTEEARLEAYAKLQGMVGWLDATVEDASC